MKLWLAEKDGSAIDNWTATHDERVGSPDPFRYEEELTHITRARVFIAQNKPDEAIRLLSCMEESARSGGRDGRLIEMMLLKALALQAAGNSTQADMALTESLTLAEPGGYTRIFLDESRPLQVLLAQSLARVSGGSLENYAIQLLSQFNSEIHSMGGLPEKGSISGALLDPLSPRELQVLHLLALGKTNSEIGEQLIVARGTIKAHTASIYRKLYANNRTEAVARARQLGILP